MEMRNDSSALSGKRKVRNDIILIVALVLIVAVAAVFVFVLSKPGDTVVVTVDGKVYGEYSLSVDREIGIENGDGFNVLVIKDGKAFIASASCPDGVCSSHRPVSRDGESIICLPNKVVVEIHANGENSRGEEQPDIVV